MLFPGTGWFLAYRLTRSFPELLICVPAECRHPVEPRVSMAGSRMAGNRRNRVDPCPAAEGPLSTPISAVHRSCRSSSLAPWQRIRGPSACHSRRHYLRRLHLLSLVRSTRALQDCSDRVLAEPDMATDQPVAQTSLCQLEDLLRLAVRWTLSWLAAEPLTACLGDGDAGLDALADKVPLELGERRHHRGDHLAVRRRQVELQA